MSEIKNILIFAGTVLLAVVIFCLCTRYQMLSTHDDMMVYMYDRITAKCWVHAGEGYVITKEKR
jgi:hypothetical protein